MNNKKKLLAINGTTFARDMRLRTPWTGLEPGNDWLLGFMKRHPDL